MNQKPSENFFIYGQEGVGLTHLLQASCHAVNQSGKTAAYLPLSNPEITPAILEDLEKLSLICLDDVQSVIGDKQWEEALFHCYNRLQLSGVHLLIASHISPNQLPFILPDLKSRFLASLLFLVEPLADAQKIAALQHRAKNRGMNLPKEVGQYLLSRSPRDMHALFAILEQLDKASLVEQRRLTIPFVRSVLVDRNNP